MADADILIIAARGLPCHYPGRGDSCDDHRAKGTKDFTPCEPCRVRRLAEHTKTEEERRGR